MKTGGRSLAGIDEFLEAFEQVAGAKTALIDQAMSNVFSMRIIGNKTHGDLAEVALSQFLTDHLDGFDAKHVGKDLFRAKSNEEDIEITTPSGAKVPLSLKAYGVGPLQMSTNKNNTMFPFLSHLFEQERPKNNIIVSDSVVKKVLGHAVFSDFHNINVLPLIYDEKKFLYNIMIFDARKAFEAAKSITFLTVGAGRKHPVFRFASGEGQYIFEVRYGDQRANALQRGLWTHTTNAEPFFRSLTGWRNYSTNRTLVKLMGKLLVQDEPMHAKLLEIINKQ